MFNACGSLSALPSFPAPSTLTNTSKTFYNCTSATGNAQDLWNYSNITTYSSCFYNCTNLDNYSSIPSGWK
jgi:hypothetical protein